MTRLRRGDKGAALFEVIVIGMLAAGLVAQTIVTAGRLQVAGEAAAEAAEAGAAHLARYGAAPAANRLIQDLAPGASFEVTDAGAWVRVEVRARVALVGPPGAPLTGRVVRAAVAHRSPNQSRDG